MNFLYTLHNFIVYIKEDLQGRFFYMRRYHVKGLKLQNVYHYLRCDELLYKIEYIFTIISSVFIDKLGWKFQALGDIYFTKGQACRWILMVNHEDRFFKDYISTVLMFWLFQAKNVNDLFFMKQAYIQHLSEFIHLPRLNKPQL